MCPTDQLFLTVRVNYLQFFIKSFYVIRAVSDVSGTRRTKRISAEVLYGVFFTVVQCNPDIQYHNYKMSVSLNMLFRN